MNIYKIIVPMLALMLVITGVHAAAAPSGANIKVVLLSQDPDPARPGGFVDVRFKVENQGGGQTENLVFQLQPSYPFSFTNPEDAQVSIGGLQAYQGGNDKVILFYRLKIADDAPAGTSKLRINYMNGDIPYTIDTDFDVRIQSSASTLGVDTISTSPEKLSPGGEGEVMINLQNLGSNAIRDIQVSLDLGGLPFTPLGSTNQKNIARLEKNTASKISFSLVTDADAVPMVYKVPLTITYKDDNDVNFTKMTLFGIVVDKAPQYIESIEEATVYTPGSKGNVVISVSNIGSTELKFATLELVDSDEYDILSPHVVYLGNLQSDDFETGQFDIYVKPQVTGNLILKTKLTYKDNYNVEYTDIQNDTEVRMYTTEEAMRYGLIPAPNYTSIVIIVIIILAIGGYIGFRMMRKKNNGKK